MKMPKMGLMPALNHKTQHSTLEIRSTSTTAGAITCESGRAIIFFSEEQKLCVCVCVCEIVRECLSERVFVSVYIYV